MYQQLRLLKSFALPLLTYSLETINLMTAQMHQLDVCWNNVGPYAERYPTLLWLRHEPLQSLAIRFGTNSFLLRDLLY